MAWDWTNIEGYNEELSAEEKLALLDKYTPPEPPDMKQFISKTQFDKVASELAAANKKLKVKLSEEEQREQERQAEQEAIQEELKALRHESTVSKHKANYLSLGYEEALALETAEAMADNDMEKVFANMKKHSEAQKKALTAELMKQTPPPPPGEDADELKKKKELDVIRMSMGLPPLA